MNKEQKRQLRENARLHRDRIDVAKEGTEEATSLFFDALRPQSEQVIAAYWPKGKEFDPTNILETAFKKGHICALPRVCEKTRILEFIKWSPDEPLKKGAFGIMEPQGSEAISPDIIIVPLLAFDRRGYRLGQGGGYYDATLEALRAQKQVQAVGIGYASQAVLFPLPIEEHDQKLDWILTPHAITDHREE
ncbi:MAG: 5-formyltetrahydrofolate cyclo-ligase [Alphaproteobacteria bacterium]|nr:5-formyltetrahydrofolate cyclo-ligase [Alphaproteobacteria bacterium]